MNSNIHHPTREYLCTFQHCHYWCGGNTIDLYSGGVQFESSPGHQYLRFPLVPTGKWSYLLLNPFQLIYSPFILPFDATVGINSCKITHWRGANGMLSLNLTAQPGSTRKPGIYRRIPDIASRDGWPAVSLNCEGKKWQSIKLAAHFRLLPITRRRALNFQVF
jgi:hypothetical protein